MVGLLLPPRPDAPEWLSDEPAGLVFCDLSDGAFLGVIRAPHQSAHTWWYVHGREGTDMLEWPVVATGLDEVLRHALENLYWFEQPDFTPLARLGDKAE